MREARVFQHQIPAGILRELDDGSYEFVYLDEYSGPPVSLTMPVDQKRHKFGQFPPFFEGLLPEGHLLDALLRKAKLDARDYFGQIVCVGGDLVGSVTVESL